MARNSEKAQTELARWLRMKQAIEKGPIAKRPNDVSACTVLLDAERYRKELTIEISKKIGLIQNPGLGEFKLRDLNDDINKLLRLKHAWENRILELGGIDYRRVAPKELDREGSEVASNKGYKYFGAAKDLPGVRELFAVNMEGGTSRKNRTELIKHVDAGYYGYMDDDDGLLAPLEEEAEQLARQEGEEDWEKNRDKWKAKKADEEEINIYKVDDESDDDLDTKESMLVGEDGKETFVQHVMVPSQKDVEEFILEKKKALLYEKFLSGMKLDEPVELVEPEVNQEIAVP